ncbi:MAG: hypothetical protein NC082_08460 [Clostridiales bacterium]|nr:hypothetical protein [Clostridiales bacterium]
MISERFKQMIAGLAAMEPRVAGLIEALEDTAPTVSVRFNRRKVSQLPPHVAGEPLGKDVPWCDRGFNLARRPSFTLDPMLHMGLYYVQDASSMFIYHAIKEITRDIDHPVVYLDACAAPGGKTTAAIDSLPEGSLIVANEWDYKRAGILRENITKWGYGNTVVSRGDTARFRKLKSTFDIIAADVPCSGEGMMRKDPEAVAQWSPSLVHQCATRQREIIDNLWPALKEGGFFIYSTCTFNRLENEEIVQYMADTLGAEPVALSTLPQWDILPGIGTSVPCCRFMPHCVEGEGLFMAVMRKRSGVTAHGEGRQKPSRPAKNAVKLPRWVPDILSVKSIGDTLWGIEREWTPLVERLCSTLDVIAPGVELGVVKGRDLIPAQGAAMWTRLDTSLTECHEVDITAALNYLRRDTLTLSEGTPRGHVLLTHHGMPLGWVKNLGNRANNLYPAPWRILKGG